MKIAMQEVNFGETILYQQGDYKLLVDCGAKYGRKGQLAYDRVKDKIDDSTKLLITHFDEDHFNGIIQMPDTQKFEKIYLPLYIFLDKKLQNTEDVFVDVLRTWTYLIAAGKKKKISALHSLFLKLPKLVKSVYDIQCVGSNDCFWVESRKVNVLWPRADYRIRRRMYADEVLQNLRNNIDDTQNSELFEEFIILADEYVQRFLKIYRFYCANNRDYNNQEVYIEDIYEEIEILTRVFNRLSSITIGIDLDDLTRERINSISSNSIRNMNECSVVFEIDSDIIALGDISPRIIKYMNKNKMLSYEEYKVAKVQHHGTIAYWSDELPDATVYLISNSGTANLKWSIDARYGKCYSDKTTCTNDTSNRCGYYSCSQQCNMCNIGSGKTEVLIDCATI